MAVPQYAQNFAPANRGLPQSQHGSEACSPQLGHQQPPVGMSVRHWGQGLPSEPVGSGAVEATGLVLDLLIMATG